MNQNERSDISRRSALISPLAVLAVPAMAGGAGALPAGQLTTSDLALRGGGGLTAVRTIGWRTPGDGGGALLVRLPGPPRARMAWHFPAPDGVWQLAEVKPDPRMLGALGDGRTDDTAALQASLDYVAALYPGGEVYLPPLQFRTRSLRFGKATGMSGSSAPFSQHYADVLQTAGHALLLEPGATLSMQEASFLRGLVLRPLGMQFPQSAAQIARWQGCAVRIESEAHGVYIGYSFIVGFDQAIIAPGQGPVERTRIEYLGIDCRNCISISNAPDIPYVSNVHCWPFSSTGRGAANPITRSGVAFRFADKVDWGKMTDCFSFGYAIGFELFNVADCTLTGCGADNDARLNRRSSIGFKLHGRTQNTRLIGCQAAAQQIGIEFATAPERDQVTNSVSASTVWDNLDAGIVVRSAFATITDTVVRVRGNIRIEAGAQGARLSGCSFQNIAEPLIAYPASISQRVLVANLVDQTPR